MSRLKDRKRKSVINELTNIEQKSDSADNIVSSPATDTDKIKKLWKNDLPVVKRKGRKSLNQKIVLSDEAPANRSNNRDIDKSVAGSDNRTILEKVFDSKTLNETDFDTESSRISFEMSLRTLEQKESKPKDRQNAVKLLQGSGCKATQKLLMHLSTDSDENVSYQSIFILLEHKCSDANFLTNLVKKHKDASIRLSALRRLYLAQGKNSTLLVGNALLYDKCPDVRKRAAAILGMIRTNECVKFLSQALNDKNAEVRKSAVESFGLIGIIGYPLSKVRLKRLKGDEYESVRKSTEKAIKRIDDLVRREKIDTNKTDID